jgi:phage shock protein C
MQVNTPHRLYRCRNDRKVAGVAAGVAEFFDLDPTVVRVVWFLSIFFGGLGLFLYIAMALIVPLEPASGEATGSDVDPATMAPSGHRHTARGGTRWSLYFGIALVVIGAFALIDALIPGWDTWRYLGPALIVGLGGLLIAGAVRREPTQP